MDLLGWGTHWLDMFFSYNNALAIKGFIDGLKKGREPELSGRRVLQATELVFATYESSRRRGRVVLPLEIDDSPFLSTVESSALSAKR